MFKFPPPPKTLAHVLFGWRPPMMASTRAWRSPTHGKHRLVSLPVLHSSGSRAETRPPLSYRLLAHTPTFPSIH